MHIQALSLQLRVKKSLCKPVGHDGNIRKTSCMHDTDVMIAWYDSRSIPLGLCLKYSCSIVIVGICLNALTLTIHINFPFDALSSGGLHQLV